MDNLDYHISKPATDRYGISKAGVWALGVEYARRYTVDGIVSVPINPGNIASELARDQGALLKTVARVVGYAPVQGAYTELFAAFSPKVTIEKSGHWGESFGLDYGIFPTSLVLTFPVVPFGRFYPLREDLPKAAKLESEGGTSGAYKFWEWNENQVKAYL